MYTLTFYSGLSLFISNIYFLLAFYILLRNPTARTNQLFALLGTTMAIWGFSEGLMRAAIDPNTAYFWGVYIIGLGSTFHSAVLLHFWLVFSGQINGFKKKLPILVIYIPAFIFITIRLFFPDVLIKGVTLNYWGYSIEGSRFYIFYMLYIVTYGAIVIFLAFRTAAKSTTIIRQQARNIGLGVLFVVLVGLITQVLRPLFNLQIPELTVTSTIVFVSFIAYAINKYGLLVITTRIVSESILNTIEDYVIAINKELKIVYGNPAIQKKLGFHTDEIMNQPLSSLLQADITNKSFDDIYQAFPLSNYQAQLVTKDNQTLPVSVNASILQDGPNAVFGFVFVARDVSKLNELIKNLEQKTKELEDSKSALETSNQELAEMNKFMTGREIKMTELKEEIDRLKGIK